MAKSESMVVNIKGGASFCAVMDVLELGQEMLNLIPDWHKEEKERFAESLGILQATAMATMKLNDR